MVELALHDELEAPYVENINESLRVHLGMNHTSEDIRRTLNIDLNEEQLNLACDLLSNDARERNYIRTADFVLIRPAD